MKLLPPQQYEFENIELVELVELQNISSQYTNGVTPMLKNRKTQLRLNTLTVKLVNEKNRVKEKKKCDYEQQGQNKMAWIKEG